MLPIVLSMGVLIGLLCLLLYYNVSRRRYLKKAMESSLIFSGAPISFSYRDLQNCTNSFSQMLGVGMSQNFFFLNNFMKNRGLCFCLALKTGDSVLLLVVVMMNFDVLNRRVWDSVQRKLRRWDIDCCEETREGLASWGEGIHHRGEYYWLYASYEFGSSLWLLL